MYNILAIAAGVIGTIVTIAAIFTVWYVGKAFRNAKKTSFAADDGRRPEEFKQSVDRLLRWTFFDYAVLFVFFTGFLFLLSDLLGVVRDQESYPYYHYGYLLTGVTFSTLGMLFMVVRFSVVLRLLRFHRPSFPHHHQDPEQADQPKQRIQG
jgi:uncharacterized ion transporter superfamily protein YfcC